MRKNIPSKKIILTAKIAHESFAFNGILTETKDLKHSESRTFNMKIILTLQILFVVIIGCQQSSNQTDTLAQKNGSTADASHQQMCKDEGLKPDCVVKCGKNYFIFTDFESKALEAEYCAYVSIMPSIATTAYAGVPMIVKFDKAQTGSFQYDKNEMIVSPVSSQMTTKIQEVYKCSKDVATYISNNESGFFHEFMHTYHESRREKILNLYALKFNKIVDIIKNNGEADLTKIAIEKMRSQSDCALVERVHQRLEANGLLPRFVGDAHTVSNIDVPTTAEQYGSEYFAVFMEAFAYNHDLFCRNASKQEIKWVRENLSELTNEIKNKPACFSAAD